MDKDFLVGGEKYISAKRAAREVGYTDDYVGQLCRSGSLKCRRIGRSWYVSRKSILAHRKASKISRAISKPNISEKGKDLFLGGERYIPSLSAAREVGYTHDYVGQLARSGALHARMVGRAWYVSRKSILEHKNKNTLAKPKQTITKAEAAPQKPEATAPQIFYKPQKADKEIKYESESVVNLPQLQKPAPKKYSKKELFRDIAIGAASLVLTANAAQTWLPEISPQASDRVNLAVAGAFDRALSIPENSLASINFAQNVSTGWDNLKELVFGGILLTSQTPAPTPVKKPLVELPKLAVTPSLPQIDIGTVRSEIQKGIETFARTQTVGTPTVIYRNTPIDLEKIAQTQVVTNIYQTVSSQSGGDTTNSALLVNRLANGGTLTNSIINSPTISKASLSDPTFSGLLAGPSLLATSSSTLQNFTFTTATGTSATTTTLFTNKLDLTQLANGRTIINASRITDAAPSGDFISYKNAAGNTDLFRVDNSGNILAGGITSSGAFTITSVSTPQFRVQYDPSNENTTSVSSAGVSTFAMNGTTPRAIWMPQMNGTSTFQFQDAGGNSALSIDTLVRRVGIGTTTPQWLLQLSTSTAPQLTLSDPGSLSNNHWSFRNVGGTLYLATSSPTTFATSTNTALTINANGNVGIGTTSPAVSLLVQSTSAANTIVRAQNYGIGGAQFSAVNDIGSSLRVVTFATGNAGALAGIPITNWATLDYTGAGMLIGTAGGTTAPLVFETSGNERMRIDSAGNVGIGTTTPASVLDIRGAYTAISNNVPSQVFVADNASSQTKDKGGSITFGGWSSNLGRTYMYGNVAGLAESAAGTDGGYLALSTENSGQVLLERVRITSTGSVGIGTSTPTGLGSGGTRTDLQVHNDGTDGISFGNLSLSSNSTGAGAIMGAIEFGSRGITGTLQQRTALIRSDKSNATASNSSGILSFWTSDGTGGGPGGGPFERMRIDSAGNVGIGTTTPSGLGTGANMRVLHIHATGGASNAGAINLSTDSVTDNALTGELSFGTGGSASPARSASIVSRLIGSAATNVSGHLDFFTSNAGTLSEAMRIDKSGNLGIGTTSPAAKLGVLTAGIEGITVDVSGTGNQSYLRGYAGTANMFNIYRDSTTNNATINTPNGNLILNPGSGLVGIGTTTPTSNLHVYSTGNTSLTVETNGAASVPNINLKSGALTWQIGNNSNVTNHPLLLTDGTHNNLVLLDNSNIGVGTLTPGGLLTLNAAANTSLALRITQNEVFKGAVAVEGSTPTYYTNAASGDLVIASAGNIRIGSSGSTGEKLFINTTSGNVGVGTTSPAQLFSVGGSAFVGASAAGGTNGGLGVGIIETGSGRFTATGRGTFTSGDLRVGANGIDAAIQLSGTNNWDFFHDDTNDLAQIRRNSTAFFTILSSGNVGIGTTNPGQKLTVSTSVGFPGIANGAGTAYVCETLATGVISTSTSACNASSLRYKDNVAGLSQGLADVLKLRPVTFTYKPEMLVSGNQVGFIAEEVVNVIPEVVGFDSLGRPDNVDYAKLTPLLTKAIQELNTKVDAVDLRAASTSLSISTSTPGFTASVLEAMGATLSDGIIYMKHLALDTLSAKQVNADKLCVEDVCVTRAQFLQIVATSGGGAPSTALPTPEPVSTSTSTPPELTASTTPASDMASTTPVSIPEPTPPPSATTTP